MPSQPPTRRFTRSTGTGRRTPKRGPFVFVRCTHGGAWLVTLNHADEPITVHETHDAALRAAKEYVAAHPGAVLRDRMGTHRAG